jgi:hypothetical protein
MRHRVPPVSPAGSAEFACPMCVGAVSLTAVATDPEGAAARAMADRDRNCLGCYGSGRALCTGCRRGTGDVLAGDDWYCVFCARALDLAEAGVDDVDGGTVLTEEGCRFDEIDWLRAA